MARASPQTTDQLPTGTTLAGKYVLQRVLGAGGMGVVYAARHTFTGKHCAVKVLHESESSAEGFSERFLREARAAAEIDHPSVCDVYDAGETPDGTLYMVLELLEGRDLAAAIEHGDLSTREIIEIGIQTLDALDAAHRRGIIHRDVKPENVFLTRDADGSLRVKLLDFGVAKNIARLDDLYRTRPGHVVGTPLYMAPEQAEGHEADARADLYSVGAMLFHAFTGEPPFQADNYNRLIIRLLSEEAPSLADKRKDLPKWLVRMVDNALRKEPTMRWWCVAQMAEGLRNAGKKPKKTINWEEYASGTTRTRSPFATESAQAQMLATGDTLPPESPPPAPASPTPDPVAMPHSGERPTRKLESARRTDEVTEKFSTVDATETPSGFVTGILVGLTIAVLTIAAAVLAWWLSR